MSLFDEKAVASFPSLPDRFCSQCGVKHVWEWIEPDPKKEPISYRHTLHINNVKRDGEMRTAGWRMNGNRLLCPKCSACAPHDDTLKTHRLLSALLAPTVAMMKAAGIARVSIESSGQAVLQMDGGETIKLEMNP